MEPSKPYQRTLQDELDWKLLDQLHAAVAQISSFCFEVKKFCVTTLFVVLTLMTRLTEDKLDDSVFVAGLLISVCFWFLDSTAYYYQVKLRGTMEAIRARLSSREEQPILVATGEQVIEPARVSAPIGKRVFDAGVNHSMWVYALLVVVDLCTWTLFQNGLIK